MKKLIALLISASMLVCMSACGKTLPEGMSQELYDTSVKASLTKLSIAQVSLTVNTFVKDSCTHFIQIYTNNFNHNN